MAIVKNNVQEMEDEISATERNYTLQPFRAAGEIIKGKLGGLFDKVKEATSSGSSKEATSASTGLAATKTPGSGIPTVFKTKDYFGDQVVAQNE